MNRFALWWLLAIGVTLSVFSTTSVSAQDEEEDADNEDNSGDG